MKRVKSEDGHMIALLSDHGSFDVVVTKWGVMAFNNSWPCSVLNDDAPIRFGYASNGDLTDISTDADGSEVVALSEDAQAFGDKIIRAFKLLGGMKGHEFDSMRDALVHDISVSRHYANELVTTWEETECA